MAVPTNIKTLLSGSVVEWARIEFKEIWDAEADHFFNYPYAAVDESLCNAAYHKGYDVREPIEVRVLPYRIKKAEITLYTAQMAKKNLPNTKIKSRCWNSASRNSQSSNCLSRKFAFLFSEIGVYMKSIKNYLSKLFFINNPFSLFCGAYVSNQTQFFHFVYMIPDTANRYIQYLSCLFN